MARGNAVVYGLTAGIYSESEKELEQFFRTAQAGVLYANPPFWCNHWRMARLPDVLRVERVGRGRQGWTGALYDPALYAERSLTIMHEA